MAYKLVYIPDDNKQNYPFYRLQLVVETFRHSTLLTKQLKFNKNLQSC